MVADTRAACNNSITTLCSFGFSSVLHLCPHWEKPLYLCSISSLSWLLSGQDQRARAIFVVGCQVARKELTDTFAGLATKD